MDIEKVVGSGTFGVVFKATIKETGERVDICMHTNMII
jgi:UDP-galactopyranose mutase